MSDFNYIEYLRNNPLRNSKPNNPLITESQKINKSLFKSKINKQVVSILTEADEDYEKISREVEYDTNSYSDIENELLADLDESLYEAKKDEDKEEDEEDVELDMEPEEDLGGGDIEALDPEAGLTQNEQDIQNALKVAYDNAIELGDEKLSKQIGNTITMFTRTRIVGDSN